MKEADLNSEPTATSQSYAQRSIESLALDVALYGVCPMCQTRYSYPWGDERSAEAIGCHHNFHAVLNDLRERIQPTGDDQ